LRNTRRRSVHAGGEQDKRFFSWDLGQPIEDDGNAGREVELAEAEIEVELVQRPRRGPFVGGEIENGLRRMVVAGDGHAVAFGQTI